MCFFPSTSLAGPDRAIWHVRPSGPRKLSLGGFWKADPKRNHRNISTRNGGFIWFYGKTWEYMGIPSGKRLQFANLKPWP